MWDGFLLPNYSQNWRVPHIKYLMRWLKKTIYIGSSQWLMPMDSSQWAQALKLLNGKCTRPWGLIYSVKKKHTFVKPPMWDGFPWLNQHFSLIHSTNLKCKLNYKKIPKFSHITLTHLSIKTPNQFNSLI